MNPFSIGCFILSGVSGSGGVFYLLLYLRRRTAREHLPFALLCLSLAAYDVFCAGLYGAETLAVGVFWQRLQLSALTLTSIFTVWFLGLITDGHLGRVHRVLVWIFALSVVPALLVDAPGITLSVATPAVKPIDWNGRTLITYYESEVGLVTGVGVGTAWFAYMYLFYRLYGAYRRQPSRDRGAILAGQVVFFAGLTNDGLVAAGAYDFVYVSEYAYLVVVLTMAYALQDRFVVLHEAVERLNRALELRVQDARADIKALRGMIPICAWCKKIRNDQGYWSQIESYLKEHTDVTFSHGVCPDCANTHFRAQGEHDRAE